MPKRVFSTVRALLCLTIINPQITEFHIKFILHLKIIIFHIITLTFILSSSVQSAENGGMPQLDPKYWVSQIVWLVLTFGILYIILSKLILPKISDNLETRKSQILENSKKQK